LVEDSDILTESIWRPSRSRGLRPAFSPPASLLDDRMYVRDSDGFGQAIRVPTDERRRYDLTAKPILPK